MAKMVLKAAYVSLASTDLSAHTSKIEASVEVEEKDVTTFASEGWVEVIGGLASGQLALGFKQSIVTAGLDDIMWPLFGTVVPFEVRLKQDPVGPSNPAYRGSVLIKEWKPIGGAVGDTAELDVTYPTSGKVERITA